MLKCLLVLLLSFFCVTWVICDCGFGAGFYSADYVQQCLTQIPFSEEIRSAAIDNLKKTLPMYAFIDIVKNFPEYKIDLMQEIEKLKTKQYNSDTVFYQDLIRLFQRLEDAHTFYYPPSCYFAFYFMQPFQLISYFDENTNQNVIEIAKITTGSDFGLTFTANQMSAAYKTQYDLDIIADAFVGCKINSINNLSVKDYFLKYLDPIVASAKDQHIRYNMAISRYFTIRQQARFAFPDDGEKTLNYKLSCPGQADEVQISVPWIGYSSKTFLDLDTLTKTCRSKPASLGKPKLDDPVIKEWENSRDKKTFVATKKAVLGPKNEEKLELLFQGDNAKFYVATENTGTQFGILKLSTFAPNDYESFIGVILKGTLESRNRNLRRLVIDLTGNGGGEICLGYALAKYFHHMKFQNDFTDNLLGATDMKYTDLGSILAQKGSEMKIFDNVWTQGMWKDEEGRSFYFDEWYNKPVSKSRGPNAKPELFSRFIKEGSCEYLYNLFQMKEPVTFAYSPDEMILLTDGYCASTCYLFSSRMMQSKLAKTVVVGGIPKENAKSKFDAEKFSPNFIPGGQVYELSELVNDVYTFGLEKNPIVPLGVGTTARFRFTLREVYAATNYPHTESETPLEFVPKNADFAMYFSKNSALDHNQVYFEIPRFFNTCAPGFVDTENCESDEIFRIGRVCQADGSYSPKCQVVGCGENYQLEVFPEANQCFKCKPGTTKKLLSTGVLDDRRCYACPQALPSNAKWVDEKCNSECVDGYYFNTKDKKCVALDQGNSGGLGGIPLPMIIGIAVAFIALFVVGAIVVVVAGLICFGIGAGAGTFLGGPVKAKLLHREPYEDIERQSINNLNK